MTKRASTNYKNEHKIDYGSETEEGGRANEKEKKNENRRKRKEKEKGRETRARTRMRTREETKEKFFRISRSRRQFSMLLLDV